MQQSKSKFNLPITVFQRKIIVLVAKIVGTLLILFILLFCVFGFTRVDSQIMAPSIDSGDLVLVFHLDHNYQKGDAVVYKCGDKKCAGRIAGVYGDKIDTDINGQLFINDQLLESPYYIRNSFPANTSVEYPLIVGENTVFILGDNRSEYDDSRQFGVIKISDIEGHIIGMFRSHGL